MNSQQNKNNRNSLVSVCIPTYNGEQYIREALGSVISQSYRPLEIVIADDDSTDNTLKVIKEVTKGWAIPVHIYNHTPSGIGANWNYCVSKAKGKYIKFLFQDDLIYPNCISEMVALAEKDDEVGLVFCNRDIIGSYNKDSDWFKLIKDLSGYWEHLNTVQPGRLLLKQHNFLSVPGNKVGEPSVVLLRMDCFNTIGNFSEQLKQSLDYEYWYRVMTQYKVAFTNKKLAAFRLHSNQATQLNALKGEDFKESMLYFRSVRSKLFFHLSIENKLKIIYLEMKYRIKSLIWS